MGKYDFVTAMRANKANSVEDVVRQILVNTKLLEDQEIYGGCLSRTINLMQHMDKRPITDALFFELSCFLYDYYLALLAQVTIGNGLEIPLQVIETADSPKKVRKQRSDKGSKRPPKQVVPFTPGIGPG